MNNAGRLREAAAALLSMSDVDAVAALMFASGKWPSEVADASGELCRPNGRADRLVAKFRSDPAAARTCCRAIVRRFQPFAEIVREILPGPGKWTQSEYPSKFGYGKKPHKFLTAAEVDERHNAEVKRERKRTAAAARFVMSFDEAAAAIGVKKKVAIWYSQHGKLDPVRPEGKRKAVGVTSESVRAYLAHLAEIERNHAAVASRRAAKERDTEQRKTCGLYFAEDGRRITAAERMSAAEAEAVFGYSSHIQINTFANQGRIERVYDNASRRHCVGYLRTSVLAWYEEWTAAKASPIYYTAAGKIVGAERMSRAEAAASLHCHELTVTAYARSGELERVYADPGHVAPCGYTRESVARFLQSHPHHIPAKAAVAAEDFQIEVLPPKPRAHGLRAARLDPADEIENAEPETEPKPTTAAKRKREKPALVFTLPPQHTDTEGEQTTMSEQTQTPKPAAPEKLEVAKAYTVHVGGVIRAICVSESDRDEIVAALDLYRKTKAAPGEIESALAFYRNARTFLGIEAQPDKGQADATATGEPPQQ